ncbi:MAG TPA: hypothetical protein VKI19_01405 [Acidimicrobiales bacterium]|nr:hypothetical protein [Acidimicrobiales bacterium]
MKGRSTLTRVRGMFLSPVIHRFDLLAEQMEIVEKRLTEIEGAIQAVQGRAETVSERAVAQQETQARLARRLDEIEKLLSQP